VAAPLVIRQSARHRVLEQTSSLRLGQQRGLTFVSNQSSNFLARSFWNLKSDSAETFYVYATVKILASRRIEPVFSRKAGVLGRRFESGTAHSTSRRLARPQGTPAFPPITRVQIPSGRQIFTVRVITKRFPLGIPGFQIQKLSGEESKID